MTVEYICSAGAVFSVLLRELEYCHPAGKHC